MQRRTGQTIAPERAELKTLGLNHLSWHRGFTVDGEDVWPLVIEGTLAELRESEHPAWDPALIETLQMLPNYYLSYFYSTAKKLAEQEQWPPSRAETVMQVEADLLAEYADPSRTEPPADLMKRGGAWYSTVATQLLNAHYNDLGETHVVNVPHARRGAGLAGRLGAGVAGAGQSRRCGAAAGRAAAAGLLRPAGSGQVLRAAHRRGGGPRRPHSRVRSVAGPSPRPVRRPDTGRAGRFIGHESAISATIRRVGA